MRWTIKHIYREANEEADRAGVSLCAPYPFSLSLAYSPSSHFSSSRPTLPRLYTANRAIDQRRDFVSLPPQMLAAVGLPDLCSVALPHLALSGAAAGAAAAPLPAPSPAAGRPHAPLPAPAAAPTIVAVCECDSDCELAQRRDCAVCSKAPAPKRQRVE